MVEESISEGYGMNVNKVPTFAQAGGNSLQYNNINTASNNTRNQQNKQQQFITIK